MDQFQPQHRFGHLVSDAETPANVYWHSEFPTVSSVIYVSPDIGVGIRLPPAPEITEIDGLEIGKEIKGGAPFGNGIVREIHGHITAFIPQYRTADTISFCAEITLVEPVRVHGKSIQKIDLPIEMIRIGRHC